MCWMCKMLLIVRIFSLKILIHEPENSTTNINWEYFRCRSFEFYFDFNSTVRHCERRAENVCWCEAILQVIRFSFFETASLFAQSLLVLAVTSTFRIRKLTQASDTSKVS